MFEDTNLMDIEGSSMNKFAIACANIIFPIDVLRRSIVVLPGVKTTSKRDELDINGFNLIKCKFYRFCLEFVKIKFIIFLFNEFSSGNSK